VVREQLDPVNLGEGPWKRPSALKSCFLEGKLQELNEDLTSRQQTNADIERIEAQIQIVNHLLKHNRVTLEECAPVRTVRVTQAEISPRTLAKGLKEKPGGRGC
jgi:hypothetical protein